MDVQIEQFADLDAVEIDAAGELGRDRQASMFDRLSWFRLSNTHLAGLGPIVLRARSGGGTAWLFLSANKRSASQLGRWYTLRFAPVFTGGTGESTRSQLLAALARVLRLRASTVTLSPLDARGRHELAAAFRSAGWVIRTGETSANWSVSTANQSFADFWQQRPSRLRATVARKIKAAPLRTEIFFRFDEDAWVEFEQVFAASWKPAEGSPSFLRALAEQEGRAGTLRLGLAYLDGVAIAAQFWLVENGVATIHKLAHAREHDRLSPGSVLTAAMMERVVDRDRPARVDFGAGDDRYKADWMTDRVPLHTLEAADPRQMAGLARICRWQLARLVRRRRLD